jgi:catechol 2,3-dioxygenase-like lactoylglutathione lyase family enzyme
VSASPPRQLIAIAPRFFVADIHRSVAYYRDVLGFNVDRLWNDPPTFCMPHRDGLTIMLGQVNDPTLIRPHGADGETWDVYVWVRDADALFAEFQAKGALIVHPPVFRPYYRNQEFAIRDPDGYILGFAHTVAVA